MWGPLNTLTYWALSHPKYGASTIVATARKALVKQARAMLLSVWQESHHVCENYSPFKQVRYSVANPVRVRRWPIALHCPHASM